MEDECIEPQTLEITPDLPTLVVQTVYFKTTDRPETDPERRGAARLGHRLYDLLTRPSEGPWRQGPGITVRVATESEYVQLDEAQHVVLVPVLGEAAFADPTVRKRAVERVREWNEQLDRSGAVLPLLINDAWHDLRHDLPRQSVRREFLADLATPAADVLAT
ncbi:MAG: hypothetical protein AAGM22_10205, partial [Acidobacteriota bacterium]